MKTTLDTNKGNNSFLDIVQQRAEEVEEALSSSISTGSTEAEPDTLLHMPTSPAITMMNQALNYGIDASTLAKRHSGITHSSKIQYEVKGADLKYKYTSDKAEVEVILRNMMDFAGNNKPAKKMLRLCLIELPQAYSIKENKLFRDYIQIPLQALIDMGMYGTIRSARVGANTGLQRINSLSAHAEYKDRGKKKTVTSEGGTPFYHYTIKDGIIKVYLDTHMNWDTIAHYWTLIPKYALSLHNNASDLIWLIFDQARQHANDIAKNGCFTISMKKIQDRLDLPDIGVQSRRDIIDPIEDAINEIIDRADTEDFYIEPNVSPDAPASEYLGGHITIHLKGKYATAFREIAANTSKQIAAAERRTEKAQSKQEKE